MNSEFQNVTTASLTDYAAAWYSFLAGRSAWDPIIIIPRKRPLNYVIKKFLFQIREIRTDNGHEFQAKFHWHVEDLGIRHAYIKRGTPQLNGKVERSHRSDQEEFYQLLTYKDDVDLNAKLGEWESFYNFSRPHGALNGKTPYEALREKL